MKSYLVYLTATDGKTTAVGRVKSSNNGPLFAAVAARHGLTPPPGHEWQVTTTVEAGDCDSCGGHFPLHQLEEREAYGTEGVFCPGCRGEEEA